MEPPVRTLIPLLLAAAGVPFAAPGVSLTAQERASDGSRVAHAARADVVRAHLEFLADDALEGRAPGTRGGTIAAKYIATQFRRLGLEPAGDSGRYEHAVPIISLTPQPTLQVDGDAAPLEYRKDYVLWSMRNEPQVRTKGEVVFVGHGIVAPEYSWNDYQGADVKGKIVLVMVNDPGLRDSTIFRGKILTYYGRWTYKIEEAQRQGAAGIILVHTLESATYPWTTVASSWSGPQVRVERPATSLLVAGWLTEAAAGRLASRGGQDLTRLMAAAARRGFKAVPLGVQLDAAVTSTVQRSATYNIVARLPGRGPRAAEAVVLGAHYDHLGVGTPVQGDSIYNGAEDNASGTAAMLAAAEAFAASGVRPARSMVFLAFAAEESGLLGSTAYAAAPTIPLKQISAVINMDVMNMHGRTRDIAALGVDQSSLGTLFTRAAVAEGLRVSTNEEALIQGSFFRSDHFPFARAGVPALSLESGLAFVGRPEDWGRKQQEEYTANRYHQPSG
jgi:Zn-dependent M28 family amino/carboxypeptidase